MVTGTRAALPRTMLDQTLPYSPVHVEVQENGKTCRELDAQKHGRLGIGHCAASDRTVFGPVWGENMAYIPTLASIFASHMSLIVQPALRITNEPTPNRARFVSQAETGAPVNRDARVMDQVHGI